MPARPANKCPLCLTPMANKPSIDSNLGVLPAPLHYKPWLDHLLTSSDPDSPISFHCHRFRRVNILNIGVGLRHIWDDVALVQAQCCQHSCVASEMVFFPISDETSARPASVQATKPVKPLMCPKARSQHEEEMDNNPQHPMSQRPRRAPHQQ